MKRKKGDGSIFQRGAVWWIKYYRNGKPYRETSGSERKSEARKLLKKRLGEITLSRFVGPDAERVTIRELAVQYLNDYRVNQKKSLDKAERMVKRYDDDRKEIDSELMAYFGDYKAHSVGTDKVKAYVAKRLEQGAANATINRELAALKRMYNLGLAVGNDPPQALDSSGREANQGLSQSMEQGAEGNRSRQRYCMTSGAQRLGTPFALAYLNGSP